MLDEQTKAALDDLERSARHIDLFFACRSLMLQNPALAETLRPYYTSSSWMGLYHIVNTCDWLHYETLQMAVAHNIEHINHFWFVGETTAAAPALNRFHQKSVAERFVAQTYGHYPTPFTYKRPSGKIKVAVIGADFHNQATAYLFIGVVEQFDKEKFSLHAYDFGPKDDSDLRRRCERAYQSFTDISEMSDLEAAQKLQDDGIDILIHMRGLPNGRLGIAAHRPCGVQIQYLYFPGTSGAPFMDYLVADDCVIPPEYEDGYTEQILRIPGCYQPNDSRRKPAPDIDRARFGLDESMLVMANFSQNYKYNPEMFNLWCHLLHRDTTRVLWLLDGGDGQRAQLRAQAAARNIHPDRLIFSPPMSNEMHLARLRCADVILDTFPYNGHTLTSDALWAGTPVVTRVGETYASRVAGSLLRAMDLTELIAYAPDDYINIADRLLRDAVWRTSLREKIAANRKTSDLFNSERYARKMEEQLLWTIKQRWGPRLG